MCFFKVYIEERNCSLKSFKKVVTGVTFAAMLTLPLTAFAQDKPVPLPTPTNHEVSIIKANVGAKYVLSAKATVKGNLIDIKAYLKGGAVVKSSLLNSQNWEIVDQQGRVIKAEKNVTIKNKDTVVLHAQVKNLKPHLSYCLDVRLKGQLGDLIKAGVKLEGKKGIVKHGLLCTKPVKDHPKNPKEKQPKKTKQKKDDGFLSTVKNWF
jgi:hypothetical protein